MEELEFRLDYCDECMQMTNHIGDDCQKCKAKENKTSRYDDDDIEEYRIKNEI